MSALGGLGSAFKDINRLREILTVLARHGFGFLIDRLQLDDYISARIRLPKKRKFRASPAERVRMMLEELGPTFVKLGQALSMRPDIVPEDYIIELSKLQDRVPSFSEANVERVIREELGEAGAKLFKRFDKKPMAAASIAQVHRAVTKEGGQVVLKLQRPGLKKIVIADLEILRLLAKAWEKFGGEELPRRPIEFVDEFENIIREELDFLVEARHLERFQANFKSRPDYGFPKVYWKHSTSRCLCLEYVAGRKFFVPDKPLSRPKREQLAQRLFNAYILMTLEDRFFHADPHTGNFILDSEGKIIIIDAGQVGRLDTETEAAFTDMLLALNNQDIDTLVEAYLRLGTADDSVDRRLLKKDISIFLEQYYDLPIEKISFGKALQNLIMLSIRHHIKLPPDFVILAKTFLGVEGICRRLNPNLNLIQAARPTAEAILRQRYNPRRLAREFVRKSRELQRFLLDLPGQTQDLLNKIIHGRLKIVFEHKGLEDLQHNLDRAGNRLSFAMVVAALIIGSALILTSQIGPQWGGFSLLGLIGFLLAGFFGIVLIIAILRSGRM